MHPDTRASARRSRQHPAAAHAESVGLAGRLRCDARTKGAPHNSLRELRSLRSDRCGESVVEARCARRPWHCASRRPRNRLRGVPPAAQGTTAAYGSWPLPLAAKPRAGGRWRAIAQQRSTGAATCAHPAWQATTRRIYSSGARTDCVVHAAATPATLALRCQGGLHAL